EVELSGRGEQELDGAGAEVAHRAGGGGRRLAQAPPQRGSDRHGRRLLDQLLMTALDAALALAQRDDPAVGVGEHLHLDVAGAVAGGPMKVSPASATASANGARSERKPYPGWTAWQSVARAASRSLATSRYDSAAGGAPIGTARWAARTWGESRSASEYTATDSSPSSWQARMMRSAISPRFATRTRVNEAIRRQTSDVSTSAARDLIRQPERLQRLAQRRCGAGGAGVQRQGGLGPRVVVVEREAQRGEHEVARRHAVVLRVRARHPEQRPRGPADARPGRPVERQGHADRAPLRQLGERRVRVAMAAELQ